ncbi:hypothetical protein CLAFUW4_11827 [Fulvia fulva]|nr:hypothetical protein CLAFUR4_11832 [Fulvia fulva]WPV17813.1 hypothetical protein CLAFUW4_11827 [Fulvia fulva]WPV33029.1 hypothetical protein CLAFUW7_11834 [Fulvia fulva]
MKSDTDLTKKTSECLIRIYINDQAEPYLIQQRLLQSASKLLGTDTRKEQGIRIECSKEDATCWRIILYWIVQHELPDDVQTEETDSWFDENHLIMCWLLADKYEIRSFQDEAMTTLMESFNRAGWDSMTVETILKVLKQTPRGSKLRELLAEHVVEIQKVEKYVHPLMAEYVEPHRGTEFYKLYKKKEKEWDSIRGLPKWEHKFADANADFWKKYLYAPEKCNLLRFRGEEYVQGWRPGREYFGLDEV